MVNSIVCDLYCNKVLMKASCLSLKFNFIIIIIRYYLHTCPFKLLLYHFASNKMSSQGKKG